VVYPNTLSVVALWVIGDSTMNTVADREFGVNVAAASWPPCDGKPPPSDRSFQPWYFSAGRAANRRGRTHTIKIIQGKIYNFLERPTGWKCFVYHFTV